MPSVYSTGSGPQEGVCGNNINALIDRGIEMEIKMEHEICWRRRNLID